MPSRAIPRRSDERKWTVDEAQADFTGRRRATIIAIDYVCHKRPDLSSGQKLGAWSKVDQLARDFDSREQPSDGRSSVARRLSRQMLALVVAIRKLRIARRIIHLSFSALE